MKKRTQFLKEPEKSTGASIWKRCNVLGPDMQYVDYEKEKLSVYSHVKDMKATNNFPSMRFLIEEKAACLLQLHYIHSILRRFWLEYCKKSYYCSLFCSAR